MVYGARVFKAIIKISLFFYLSWIVLCIKVKYQKLYTVGGKSQELRGMVGISGSFLYSIYWVVSKKLSNRAQGEGKGQGVLILFEIFFDRLGEETGLY